MDYNTYAREPDHLGSLANTLTNMSLFTLICELLQNADDTPNVTHIEFDVQDDYLIVDNDGEFSDCGNIEAQQCPMKQQTGYMCDFHSMRWTSHRDKKNREDTTGAFGIGFTAVYTITDQPEIISAGRHWIIKEWEDPNNRIHECPGCDTCSSESIPSTRFVFPWAFDEDHPLRKELNIPPITNISSLLDELKELAPVATIFLKRVTSISVKQNSMPVLNIEREDDESSIVINTDEEKHVLWIFRDNFEEKAHDLRERYEGYVDPNLSANVQVAVPNESIQNGRLYATLPIKEELDVPFHINADFFPSEDRTNIASEKPQEKAWNQEALKCAAELIARNLDEMPQLLGHNRLYKFFTYIKDNTTDKIASYLWKSIEPKISSSRIVYTHDGQWVTPYEARFVTKQQEEAISFLEELGLHVVHPELNYYWNFLQSIGVKKLDLEDIRHSLDDYDLKGVDKMAEAEAPYFLNDPQKRQMLWDQIDDLLPETAIEERKHLRDYRIALAQDGGYYPCKRAQIADHSTVELFGNICPEGTFLSLSLTDHSLFEKLCDEFNAEDGINCLEGHLDEALDKLAELLDWFHEHIPSIEDEGLREGIKNDLAGLRIYPTSNARDQLHNLAIPGGFTDPLGITKMIDMEQLEHHHEFLKDLGARELTFETYVAEYIPKAFETQNVPERQRENMVRLLASKRDDIKDSESIKQTLSDMPIVKCSDGSFHRPKFVYFRDTAKYILGDETPEAQLRATEQNYKSTIDFYYWVGVSDKPKCSDIIERVKDLSRKSPKHASQDIAKIFQYLVKNWDSYNDKDSKKELAPLQSIKWLPSTKDRKRFYEPSDIYVTVFSHLFEESSANFLDMPADIQKEGRQFCEWLGCNVKPTFKLVIEHVQNSAKRNVPIDSRVYKYLKDYADSIDIETLRDTDCIYIAESEEYVAPEKVYFEENPFGRYRYVLSQELNQYYKLFKKLGVRNRPDHSDAIDVLQDIDTEHREKSVLDDDTLKVAFDCWSFLKEGFENNKVTTDNLKQLSDKNCIPTINGNELQQPRHVLINDRSDDLATKLSDEEPGLERLFVDKHDGWEAMEEAGAQRLSKCIERQLVDRGSYSEDETISKRINERLDELKRICVREGLDTHLLDELNQSCRCFATNSLKTKTCLQIPLWNRKFKLEPEVENAFLDEDDSLYFVSKNGSYPWRAIAYELSLSLSSEPKPYGDSTIFAFKEILSVRSREEASEILNDSNFPSLEGERTRGAGIKNEIKQIGVKDVREDDDTTAETDSAADEMPTEQETHSPSDNRSASDDDEFDENEQDSPVETSRGPGDSDSSAHSASTSSKQNRRTDSGEKTKPRRTSKDRQSTPPRSSGNQEVKAASRPQDSRSWVPECEPEDAQINYDESQPSKARSVNPRKAASSPQSSAGSGSQKTPKRRREDESEGVDDLHADEIGKWGERYALNYIRDKLATEHPGATEYCDEPGIWIYKINGQEVARVEWRNADGDQQEGYDIKYVQDGQEHLIEVKATTTDDKQWFQVERSQWDLAKSRGDNFIIYRVFNAGSEKHARIKFIEDPTYRWVQGELTAYPVKMHV